MADVHRQTIAGICTLFRHDDDLRLLSSHYRAPRVPGFIAFSHNGQAAQSLAVVIPTSRTNQVYACKLPMPPIAMKGATRHEMNELVVVRYMQ